MTNMPIRALDALTALGWAEDQIRRSDDPDGVLAAVQDAHGVLDDLLDRIALRASPSSRLAVLDALQHCADQDGGTAHWYGSRAYYGAADDELIDITALVHAHHGLFRTDLEGRVLTSPAGQSLLDQWDHDRRHPVRALLAEVFGRRRVHPVRGLTSGRAVSAGVRGEPS